MEKEAIIINPLGTYIRATGMPKAKKIVNSLLKKQKVIVLNDKQVNRYYKVKVLYKNEWIYGFILAEDLKLI